MDVPAGIEGIDDLLLDLAFDLALFNDIFDRGVVVLDDFGVSLSARNKLRKLASMDSATEEASKSFSYLMALWI